MVFELIIIRSHPSCLYYMPFLGEIQPIILRRQKMKIGYIRVSTKEQNTIRQEYLMESLGVEEVYIDRMSGKTRDRPE